MFQVKSPLPYHLADPLEAFFCESEAETNWSIESIPGDRDLHLYGFFENPEAARDAWILLRANFPEIPDNPEGSHLADRDWQDAYKDHFHPWSCEGLHWVPVWARDTYVVPEGEKALYLDPGMAFGTGNHATTRLCVEGLIHYFQGLAGEDVSTRKIIDAGCGSGILALSAWLLGFRDVSAFDIDADSIRICHENADMNGLTGTVDFCEGGIETGLPAGSANLILANILANVLVENREYILQGLNHHSSSCLVLSGILQQEVDEVETAYCEIAQRQGIQYEISRKNLGQWSALTFQIP